MVVKIKQVKSWRGAGVGGTACRKEERKGVEKSFGRALYQLADAGFGLGAYHGQGVGAFG
jgi:hypothetical protein